MGDEGRYCHEDLTSFLVIFFDLKKI